MTDGYLNLTRAVQPSGTTTSHIVPLIQNNWVLPYWISKHPLTHNCTQLPSNFVVMLWWLLGNDSPEEYSVSSADIWKGRMIEQIYNRQALTLWCRASRWLAHLRTSPAIRKKRPSLPLHELNDNQYFLVSTCNRSQSIPHHFPANHRMHCNLHFRNSCQLFGITQTRICNLPIDDIRATTIKNYGRYHNLCNSGSMCTMTG